MLALLALRPDHLLVQIGCASPEYLLAVAELVPLRYQALVVDASPERLAPFLGPPKLRPVAMEPLRFAAYPMQCDRILLEDGVLGGDPGAELARGLFSRLRPAGRLLVVGAAPRPELPAGERRALPAPRGMRAQGVLRTLEAAGFEVRRDAATLWSGRIDLFLGAKAAASVGSRASEDSPCTRPPLPSPSPSSA